MFPESVHPGEKCGQCCRRLHPVTMTGELSEITQHLLAEVGRFEPVLLHHGEDLDRQRLERNRAVIESLYGLKKTS